MKLSKKIISKGARRASLKKFSKHWLEAVKLSDVSVLADSGADESSSAGSGGGGGEIYYQIPGSPYYGSWGVGAYVSPWNTSNPSANPPVYNYSESFIVLVAGNHFGMLTIEQLGGGYWQSVASLDGETLISSPYNYSGGNQTYLEIDVDASGDWSFWGDFGSVGANHGSISPYSQAYVQFGCSAGPGDYLMYNAFSNCGLTTWEGWSSPNFSYMGLVSSPQYQAVGATEDSVLFEDNPPY